MFIRMEWMTMKYMPPKARDLLIVAAAVILVTAAVIFAVVLPALELQQVRRELETPPAILPPVTGTPFPVSPGVTAIQGPPSFSLLVTPVEARAPPGGTILYTMTIEPKGGFDDRLSLRLDVNALLLYRESFDLGTIDPPYPRTVEYRFVVPADVPSGITVKGVLSAEGGGSSDSVDLVLLVT
jgi:hypothetical protein